MRQNTLQQLMQILKRNKRSRVWQKFVRAMACVVVFCTTYALILPAITMTTATNCGLEEHAHTRECYVQTVTTMVCEAADTNADILLHSHADICHAAGGSLICTLSEITGHTHSDSCYEVREVDPSIEDNIADFVPPQETIPAETVFQESASVQVHTHSDDCYETKQGVLTCQTPAETIHTHEAACHGPGTNPICGQVEAEAHTHGEGCYESVSTLTCQTAESEGHTHGEGCHDAEGNLVCETPEAEGHTHGNGCYTAETKLTCQKAEGTGHAHSDACFDTVVTCTIPEVTVHEHNSSCYEQIRNLACGLEEGAEVITGYEPVDSEATKSSVQTELVLICTEEELYPHTHTESCGDCGLPEVISHDHTEACFQTADVTDETDTAPLTCTLAESEEHTHDFRCRGTWRLVCEIEEHAHNELCASDPEADLEAPADWEATFAHVELTGNWSEDVLLIAETQLGYTESEKNFTFFEDDPTLPRGYTRYGQWYGVPYGDWCGMFVSFCLDYAGVEEVPLNFGCRPWIEELSSEEINLYRPAEEYTPNPGDIVFFDWDGDDLSDHVGLVCELIEPTEEELAENASAPIKVKTIEGNSSNRVQYKTYTLGEDCLLGYGDITAAQENYNLKRELRHTAEFVGEDYTVTVTYSDMAGIPEGAKLVVEEILPEDERYQSFLEQVEAETASEEEAAPVEITYFRALDVHFAQGDQEIPLNAEVQVSVTFTEAEQEELNVAHFADDGTMDQPESTTELAETGDSIVSFNTDSFSGIVFYNTRAATPFLIEFDDTKDTVEWKITDYKGFSNTDTKTPADGVLSGSVSRDSNGHSYMRFKLDSGSYTIQTGDQVTICMKMTGTSGDLGTFRPTLQVTSDTDPKEVYLENTVPDTSGNYVIYSFDASPLAEKLFNFLDVKWYNATSGAKGTYYIDYIRIGQPESEPEECEHKYNYTVTDNTGCDVNDSVTYTCSICGEGGAVDAATVASSALSYANTLRTNNIAKITADDKFTWESENYKGHKWTYYNGVMMDAFMKVGTQEALDFVVDFYDTVLKDNGEPVEGYIEGSVDSVPMALALFDLLGKGDNAQNEKYAAAIQFVYDKLDSQDTLANAGGNYKHKMNNADWEAYPFALDGLYMANTFIMEYANALDDGKLPDSTVNSADLYTAVYNRLNWVAEYMYDSETGLYHHGWDGTEGNGHFWGRGIGWYAVALVDIIDMMPDTYSDYKTTLKGHLKTLFDGMLRWQDDETGMWYNVVNRDATLTDNNGNKLETSVSAMMAYSMMKAYNEGFVEGDEYYGNGLRALNGIMEHKLVDGSIIDTYKSSGVKTSDADYLTNDYTNNEAKGIGALIMAAAPDHNWSEWTVSEAQTAAAEETVTETRTCSVCKATQTRTVTSAEEPVQTLLGYKFTVVDPDNLVNGETYVVYAQSGENNYVFLLSDYKNPNAMRIVADGYGTSPLTIGKTWQIPVSSLDGKSIDVFTWKAEKTIPSGQSGNLLLQAQGCYNTTPGDLYLSVRSQGQSNIQTERIEDKPNYISLTVNPVDSTDIDADSTIKNVNKDGSNLVFVAADGKDDWQESETDATPVVFASVEPVYEETPDSSDRYQLTTVNPDELQAGVDYVIYTKSSSDDDTYTFMLPTAENPPAKEVSDTGYIVNPVTIGGKWSASEADLGDTLTNITWRVIPATDGTIQIVAQGYTSAEGAEQVICLIEPGDSRNGALLGNATSLRDDLDVTHVGSSTSAACTLANHVGTTDTTDRGYQLYYDTNTQKWTTVEPAPEGTATPVYFAAITDKEAEEEEPAEEVYNLKVLGSEVKADPDKKYVIYVPQVTPTSEGETSVTVNNVQFLGSTMNGNKGNYRRGAVDVEEDRTKLITAEETWTLEFSKMGGYSLTEIEWTVVEKDGNLCLQSVADETLYLYLDCANDPNGKRPVLSFAYDEDFPEYQSLKFTYTGNTSDSHYEITTENDAYGLHLDASNAWSAIIPDFVKVNEETGLEDDPLTVTQVYIAEVIEDTTEEENPEDPEIGADEQVVGYEFTTLDPQDLVNLDVGETLDVAIYFQNKAGDDDYTFMFSNGNFSGITANDIGDTTNPVTIEKTWEASFADMGTRNMANFTWQVLKHDNGIITLKLLGDISKEYYLAMSGDGAYARNGALKDDGSVNENTTMGIVTTTNEAGCLLNNPEKNLYLYYDTENNRWWPTNDQGTATTIFFASVKPKTEKVQVPTNFPKSVSTGNPTVNTLRFYNFVEKGGDSIEALSGCVFRIEGIDTNNSGYVREITSDNNPELHLPQGIPEGKYRITQVSAPEGYMRDMDPVREFTVAIDANGNRKFAEETTSDGKKETLNIGTFLNHANNLVEADKVGVVEDYNNRTYEIMLSAESNLRLYEMDPVDVIFVVDQSNSMLFPAGLNPVKSSGKNVTITLHKNEGITSAGVTKSDSNTKQLETLVNQEILSKDQLYYIIADEKATSTVYAIWHNGVDWMYQDASYYAKANHDNAEGYRQEYELAIYPEVAAHTEQPSEMVITDENGVEKTVEVKTNGGSLSYAIDGGTLSNDISVTTDGTSDTEKTYTIYTATNEYNRLHYLQDALAHAIHQLADANKDSTVSLIRFTRETYYQDCVDPLPLTPENVQTLITEVQSIKTDGGTRQDIALKHTFDHLMGGEAQVTSRVIGDDGKVIDTPTTVTLPDNYTKDAAHTYTVLITDGAPVLSGDAKTYIQLGTADDVYSGGETEAIANWKSQNAAANAENNITVYSRIKYYAEKVRSQSTLMTIGLGMGGVEGGGLVLERIATGFETVGQENIYHEMLEDAEDLMNTLKQLLFASMKPRAKVDLEGDITDVISDSFYPIAYTDKGTAEAKGRKLLYQDNSYDWILLQEGDWITIEGEYVGPTQGTTGAGRLTKNTAGDFQITWDDQMIYDCELVWVPLEEGKTVEECLPEGKTLVTVDDEGRIWFSLAVGDKVYAHGEYVDPKNEKTGTVGYSFLKNPNRQFEIAGEYVQGEDRAHIKWSGDYYSIDFDANFQPYLWYGKFYVKAKEDFIGGNVIDTNKSAQIEAQENDGDNIDELLATVTLDTPTVNVRLLDMNEQSSEVTVFLGDIINASGNSPLDSMKYFFDSTYFTKLISDGGDVLNKITSDSKDDGLLADVFYLRYAIDKLKDTQWNTMQEYKETVDGLWTGKEVKVEYTYDEASSHGPVGYFTFQLTKTGEKAAYGTHEAEIACADQHTHDDCTAPVETYTLHVTYTAYKLREDYQITEGQRPAENVHNGTGSPGTVVGGTEAGDTLAEGLGGADKDNVHNVHVISGKIEVTKIITGGTPAEDTVFPFTLLHSDGTEMSLNVTVNAEESSGTATVSGLKRGTWVLTETPVLGYQLQSMTVDGENTNCYSTAGTRTVSFVMGDNTSGNNVIGPASSKAGTTLAANNVDKIPTVPTYTSNTGTPNGVLGAAEVTNIMLTYELPEAGGAGTTSYTLGGLLLISIAVCLFLVYNYKSRKEDVASS